VKPGTSVAQQEPAAIPQPSATPVAGPDPQRNRLNGIYAASETASNLPTATLQAQPRTGDGWSKLATEMQSILIHALAPVCQGLIGAVLAEFLRPSGANPPASAANPSRNPVRTNPQRDERESEEWADPDSDQQPDWGERLRSTPR